MDSSLDILARSQVGSDLEIQTHMIIINSYASPANNMIFYPVNIELATLMSMTTLVQFMFAHRVQCPSILRVVYYGTLPGKTTMCSGLVNIS